MRKRRPHRIAPPTDPDDYFDVIAFTCTECGEWVKFGEGDNNCPVNWSKWPLRKRIVHAWKVLIDAA